MTAVQAGAADLSWLTPDGKLPRSKWTGDAEPYARVAWLAPGFCRPCGWILMGSAGPCFWGTCAVTQSNGCSTPMYHHKDMPKSGRFVLTVSFIKVSSSKTPGQVSGDI